jgi:hypothetical protein
VHYKCLFIAIFFILSFTATAAVIRGEVQSVPECRSEKTMVWLALNEKEFKKKLLLMHTLVPERGSFEFYVKSGSYLLTGSNEKGCSWEKVVEIKNEDQFYKVEVSEKKI